MKSKPYVNGDKRDCAQEHSSQVSNEALTVIEDENKLETEGNQIELPTAKDSELSGDVDDDFKVIKVTKKKDHDNKDKTLHVQSNTEEELRNILENVLSEDHDEENDSDAFHV